MNARMNTLMTARGVQAGYGKVRVVEGLDLEVSAGEVVALLGPNGAGKTTTLMTLSGLLPLQGGSVTVLGEPLEGTRRAHKLVRRGLGHVPEDRGLFRNLTVHQHLRLAGGESDQEEKVLELLPALRSLQDRRVGLLSGGEQQMVAMARAILLRPKLLLLDEMSLGLAPLIVGELLQLVRRLADEDGVGIVLVEQHVGLALEIADRAVVLRRGRVVYQGSSSALKDDPDTLEAAYLGEAVVEQLAAL